MLNHGPTCAILLSAKDGAEYLPAQIESIIAQDYRAIRLVVRDDGSEPKTLEILRTLAERGILELEVGKNIGAAASFFDLLKHNCDDDFVFFADQDDVWHPDKVRRAIRSLEQIPPDVPALYCSRVQVVDECLTHKGYSPRWPRTPAFGNALVENVAMGCTTALNKCAANLLASHPLPPAAIMHDWWCYLAVSAFGRVIYDPEPSMQYRIHNRNAVGLTNSLIENYLARVQRQLHSSIIPKLLSQAEAFRETFSDQLRNEHAVLIERLLKISTFSDRLSFTKEKRLYRQFWIDDILLRLLVLARGN